MNNEHKLMRKAILISMGLIIGTIIVISGIVWIAVQIKDYLPYVLSGMLFIGLSLLLAIPIKQIIWTREQRKHNRFKYKINNKRN